jgi:hypothetical protein
MSFSGYETAGANVIVALDVDSGCIGGIASS